MESGDHSPPSGAEEGAHIPSTIGATPPARILIVDALPENREILTSLLEPDGYVLITAKDGQEGLEKALLDPPDLILMDVSMPRMTGFEACRRLKADERTR